MQFHSFRGARLAVPASIALAAGIGYVTLLPAQAQSNLQVLSNLVSCGTAAACVFGSNTSIGPGVEGDSAKGSGAVGRTTFNSTSSSNGQAGVVGQDLSTSGKFNFGLKGTSKSGVGVIGTSSSNDGVEAVSSSGYGLRATSSSTTNPAVGGNNSKGGPGVFGISATGNGVTGNSTSGDGVAGVTNSGEGVFGVSDSGFGMYGFSNTSTGVLGASENYVGVYGDGVGSSPGVFALGQGGNGLEAQASSGDSVHAVNTGTGTALAALATSGDGLYSYTGGGNGGVGVFAYNANGFGADIRGSSIGLVGRAPAGTGFPLVATDSNGNNLFWVDGNGNIFYHGGIHNFARTTGGAMATEFVPNATTPTVEDNGSTQLVNGQAAVKLDPTFAATIDMQHPYRVFLTPTGDTRGLYVATKTLGGFIVHETQGGHSTLGFDYRILANSVGHAAERMTISAAAQIAPNAPVTAHHAGRTTAPLPAAVVQRARALH